MIPPNVPPRPPCDHPGCGLPLVFSSDGQKVRHWVEDPKDRVWSDSPVQTEARRGGRHAARPAADFDIDAHVQAYKDETSPT